MMTLSTAARLYGWKMCLRKRVSNKFGARVSSSHPGRGLGGLGLLWLWLLAALPRPWSCRGAAPRGLAEAEPRRRPRPSPLKLPFGISITRLEPQRLHVNVISATSKVGFLSPYDLEYLFVLNDSIYPFRVPTDSRVDKRSRRTLLQAVYRKLVSQMPEFSIFPKSGSSWPLTC